MTVDIRNYQGPFRVRLSLPVADGRVLAVGTILEAKDLEGFKNLQALVDTRYLEPWSPAEESAAPAGPVIERKGRRPT